MDYIAQTESWSLIVLNDDEISNLPSIERLMNVKSGTLVVWQNLDKFAIGERSISAAFEKKIEIVRDHLALVFHRYLSGESGLQKITIRINERDVEPKDPFLIKKSTQIMDSESIVVRGQAITVRPYILPHISKLSSDELKALGGKEGMRRLQGFYVYRNKRLLIWGTWFRLMRQGELSKLARVLVDIPNSLDELWTLDIKKSTAVPPEEVRINLANVIQRISEGSRRTWTYRGKKEVGDTHINTWTRYRSADNGCRYMVNRDHPLVQNILAEYPGSQKAVEVLLTQIEDQLPLNQLFVDLTNDEKLLNDVIHDDKSIIKLLHSILESTSDPIQAKELLENLRLTEPFCNYAESIDQAIESGGLL